MKSSSLHYGVFLFAAWLGTLGACGRTEPLGDSSYETGAGDDDSSSQGGSRGGTGGSSSTTTGGTRTGGTSSGGTSSGGTRANGGTNAQGGDFTSVGGSVVDGGTGSGGTSMRGGSAGNSNDGGSFATGGVFATGGIAGDVAMGGSVATGGTDTGGNAGMVATGGTSTMMGTGGTMTMPTGISCDGMACDPETSVCCRRRASASTCELAGTMCQSGATLECSGTAACDPGEVCCFHANFGSCQATCDVSVGSPGNPPTFILCDSAADCAPDETCVLAPRGIAYCGTNL